MLTDSEQKAGCQLKLFTSLCHTLMPEDRGPMTLAALSLSSEVGSDTSRLSVQWMKRARLWYTLAWQDVMRELHACDAKCIHMSNNTPPSVSHYTILTDITTCMRWKLHPHPGNNRTPPAVSFCVTMLTVYTHRQQQNTKSFIILYQHVRGLPHA